eukprot:2604203-Amphidinium_carterae.1
MCKHLCKAIFRGNLPLIPLSWGQDPVVVGGRMGDMFGLLTGRRRAEPCKARRIQKCEYCSFVADSTPVVKTSAQGQHGLLARARCVKPKTPTVGWLEEYGCLVTRATPACYAAG